MFYELNEFIDFIENWYTDVSDQWLIDQVEHFNTKKKHISDLEKKPELMNTVKKFRNFMIRQSCLLTPKLQRFQYNNVKISSRVKTWNSIVYKTHRYMNGQIAGGVPVNKCFNDLMGFRIVLPYSFIHEDLEFFISKKYSDLKLIDSTKNNYCASHIYFIHKNKRMFPCELQVWRADDEKSNLASHEKYKQGYKNWEKQY